MIPISEVFMPDVAKGATLEHIYDFLYNGGSYGKNPSVGDMLDKGWGLLLAYGIVLYNPTTKDVRPGRDSNGKFLTNDTVVSNYTGAISTRKANDPFIARIMNLGGDPGASSFVLKSVVINQLLGAGGTLAATELIALVAAKKLFPEEIHIELEPATANISAVGGNAAVCEFSNSGGTILAVGVLSHTKQSETIRLNGSPTAGENLRITVAAGIAGNVGASRVRGYILYREV